MSTLPAPLVPAEVDLTPLDGFMLNTTKLLSSQLCYLANGEEFKAAVMLWCQAWKEIPAASLPDDDKILSKMVRVSPAVWRRIRVMALRGFIKCSDGRLYHKVLANDALKAWAKRQDYAVRRGKDRVRLAEWREQQRTVSVPSETAHETRFTSERNGQDSGKTGTETRTEEEKKEIATAISKKAPLSLDDEMRKWASEQAPHVDLDGEYEAHLDWKRQRGRRYADDRAGFRSWLRKAEKDALVRLVKSGGSNGYAQKSTPLGNLYAGAALALARRAERAANSGAGDDPAEPLLDGGGGAAAPCPPDRRLAR